ncbi:hypothetical protein [Streptomyces sp. XH2]|uniref:hypothetical protein n=1 Tax=Streptomyces sp. XH2 TaxID=3412483 RepID=UPI003C7D454B
MTATPESKAPSVSDLDAIAHLIPTWASVRGLAVVPAVPENHDDFLPAVHMTVEHMTPEAFVDLAATAGARLLYSSGETFELSVVELDEDEKQRLDSRGRTRVAVLLHQAAEYEGRYHDVRLAFAADGVLHYWSAAQAAWYTEITEGIDGVLSGLEEGVDSGGSRPVVDGPLRLSEEEIVRLAAQLQESPEFREAPSQAQRQRIVRRLVGSHVANYWAVVERAGDTVDAASAKIFAELELKVSDLAGELVDNPEFRESSAKVRKVRVVAFLKARSGGYKPPTGLIEVLLDEASKRIRTWKQ